MLSYRKTKNASETIDDVRHPFVRLPQSDGVTTFAGWGPRI